MKKNLCSIVLVFVVSCLVPAVSNAQTPAAPTLWVASDHADTTFASFVGTWTVDEGDYSVQYMLINCDTLYVNFQIMTTSTSSNTPHVSFTLPPGLIAAQRIAAPFAFSAAGAKGIGTAWVFDEGNAVFLQRDISASVLFGSGAFDAVGQFFVKVKHAPVQ